MQALATRLIRSGIGVIALAAVAGVLELLALQVPGSRLYIGVLPGPLGALREMALTLGLLMLAAGALWSWAYGDAASATRARIAATLISIGASLALLAQLYGASQGMPGLQMEDLRGDARAVFVVRHLGLFVFAIGLGDLALCVLRRPPPT